MIPPCRGGMPRKRRSFSAIFKSKVALVAIKGHKTVAEIAKLHQVHPSQVVLWKRQLLEGVESVFDGPTDRKENRVYPYRLRGLEIAKPDHVWCSDITYIPMRQGYFYLCAVMDWHSRFEIS